MRVPNFFVVGASKAGTTSLYNYLAQHPQIYMCPIKEPNFFADEVRKENFREELQPKLEQWERELKVYLQGPRTARFTSGPVSEWQDYLRLFEPAGDEAAIGEASPCYLWSKTAAPNIAARCPGARILMILRDPIKRAFAQHLHTLSFSSHPLTFREHMDAALQSRDRKIGELYPFLEFGRYAEQVERYLSTFPRSNVRIFLYEDFQREPLYVIRDIFNFLDVDETFEPNLTERHMTARVPRSFLANRLLQKSGIRDVAKRLAGPALRRRVFPVLFKTRATLLPDPSDVARLKEFYRSDIERLAGLIATDLSRWLR